jgi:multidrug efflux pump subunit AcrB
VLNVTADVDKDNTNMTTLTEDLTTWVDELLTQYPGISYTLEGEARQQRDSFDSLGVGLAIVLFVIYCLLALPLKSYLEPLVVMSVIPFGLIGAVVGHWIMGYDLSMMSLLGLMALTGVVVNDSLVLVDFINQQRAKGVQIVEAVLTSGVKRFRPVMLTSLTTFFGLMPVMLSTSQDARFLVPMAISLGFGILFATMVTLIAVPLNILIVEDLKNWCLRLVGREQGPGTNPDKPQTVTG